MSIFAPEIRAEHYLNAMVDRLAKAAGDAEQQPVAWAFRLDFGKLRAWHEKRRYKLMNKAGPRCWKNGRARCQPWQGVIDMMSRVIASEATR
jgi:hypothetical protein